MEQPHIAVAVDLVLFGLLNNKLVVLTGHRADAPYKARASLPSTLVMGDESAEDACKRKIKSIGLEPSYLEQLATFTDPYRDPRKRGISIAYFGLIPVPSEIPKGDAKIGSMSWIDSEKLQMMQWAFDHNVMISMALQRIRSKIQYSPLSPHFLPKEFTISELAIVYSAILGRKIDLSNFRRDLIKQDLLTPVGMRRGRGPAAKTYKWNWDNVNKFFLSLG